MNIYTGDVCSWHVSTVRHVAIAVAIGGKPTSGLIAEITRLTRSGRSELALGRLFD